MGHIKTLLAHQLTLHLQLPAPGAEAGEGVHQVQGLGQQAGEGPEEGGGDHPHSAAGCAG